MSVYNPSIAREMAKRGMGAALVGNYMVKKDSTLLFYRLRTAWGERSFYFVLRRDYAIQEHQKQFLETFLDVLEER